jgi:serine/threonine protein kinase
MNSVKIVGRYELLDPIGYGGMAVVYLARQTDLDRLVALKELRLFQAPDDPGLAERFLREAHMAGKMSHPNLVTVHEYFEHEGTPYIAMEYLQRGSLRPWVGRMTTAQIAGVLEGALAALDHAEGYGIVHRDLKPENLLVTDQGQIKVADFGIAKPPATHTSPMLTATGTTVGTPTYMAPEQAMGHGLGPFTDLYSLGIMAYEFFVGHAPFDDTDTPVAIILRHVNEQIPSAHTVNPAIDRALSEWIDRLLVKDPAARTPTAEQAWDELEEVVLRLLGSRWRREARLVPTQEQPVAAPLTPAPFTSTDVDTPVPQPTSDGFQSFAWGAPAASPADPQVASDAHAVGPVAHAGPEVVTPPSSPATPEPEQPGAPAEPVEPSVAFGRTAFETFAPAKPQIEQRDDPAPSTNPFASPAPSTNPFASPAPSTNPFASPLAPAPPPEAPTNPFASPLTPQPPPPPTPISPVSAYSAPAGITPPADAELRTVMPEAVADRLRPAPQPASPPALHRRRQAALIGGGTAAVALAVGAVVVVGGGGSGGSTDKSSPATRLVDNADLSLRVPTSWSKRAVPTIPGLHRRDAVTAARADGAYVAAELVPGNADPTLLPRTLRAAQKGRPKAQTITLAGQQAYRYDGLRGRGSATNLRVYTVLTSGGVATIACGPFPPARDCDQIAGTLKLASAQVLPAGPSKSFAATLKKTFTALDARGRAAKTSLGKAGTVTAQAAALRQLASAYENAGAPGGGLNVLDSGLNARLASLFTSVASAYGRLGLAVQGNDAAGQARAQQVLKRLQARRARAAAALASVGYAERPPRLPITTVSPPRGSAPPMSGSSVTPPPPGAAPPVTPRQVTPQPVKPQPVKPAPRDHPPPPPPSGGGGGTIG